MKLIAGLVFVAMLVCTQTARADVASAPPAHLETGFGTWYSDSSDSSVHQTRFTLAPEFGYNGRLRMAPIMRLTGTNIDLLQRNSAMFDASLTFPWQPSLGGRVSYEVARPWRLRLILIGEFESPLGENRGRIDSFTPKGKLATQAISLESLRNHVAIDHSWRSVQGALRIKGDFGWWQPYVDVGYMSISGRLAVNFDSVANTMLSGAGLSPDRQYNAGGSSVFYMVGSQFSLGRGIALRLNGTFLPSSDTSIYAGEAFLVLPIRLGSK